MKYRKKPVVIEAVQFKDENVATAMEIMDFLEGSVTISRNGREVKLIIETLEGDMFASIGDYIIKGVHGEFYPCKADIFEETYEKVEEENE